MLHRGVPGRLKPFSAKRLFQAFALVISTVRLLPHTLVLLLSPERKTVRADMVRWITVIRGQANMPWLVNFFVLMTFFPEFRNLFYHRVGLWGQAFMFLCPRMSTLFIHTKKIGPGLFIQHGFSTIIAAQEIGENCWINQQVTIGFSNETECPVIGHHVTISAGAKVIGGIKIGNHSRVGANAVVVKNVPSNVTVVGVPAYIIKRDGRKLHEKL